MNRTEAKQLLTPNPLQMRMRLFFEQVYTRLAPSDVEISDETAETINKLAADRYSFLVLGPHFSRREGFDYAMQSARLIPGGNKMPILMPISKHQYDGNGFILDLFAKISGITLAPIVNKDTVDHWKKQEQKNGEKLEPNEMKKLGYGFFKYVHMMSELIDLQGISGISPQTGRRTTLSAEQAKANTLETLLKTVFHQKGKQLKKESSPTTLLPTLEEMIRESKIAIMFMGIRPAEGTDYEKIHKSYDLFKKHKISIGPILTINDVYRVRDVANGYLTAGGESGHITLDEVILAIMSDGVDQQYNRIDRNLPWVKAVFDAVSSLRS